MGRTELHKLTVGRKIKYYRSKKGYGQTELSKLSNIPLATLKVYEKGERLPKSEPLKKLASVLECSVYDLINIECDSEEDVVAIISQPNVRKYLNGAIKKLQNEINEEINYHSSLVNNLMIAKEEIADIELKEKE